MHMYVNNYLLLIIYARVTKHKNYKIFKFCNFSIHVKKNSLRMMNEHQTCSSAIKNRYLLTYVYCVG